MPVGVTPAALTVAVTLIRFDLFAVFGATRVVVEETTAGGVTVAVTVTVRVVELAWAWAVPP